jgi:hypothetical protein
MARRARGFQAFPRVLAEPPRNSASAQSPHSSLAVTTSIWALAPGDPQRADSTTEAGAPTLDCFVSQLAVSGVRSGRVAPVTFRRIPCKTPTSCKTANAGGGTRTPDTRIMIPSVFPVFTGDSGVFGREIGLFCQRVCQFLPAVSGS